MVYGFKIAWRYLTSNKTQTGLLIAGVAVGVFVFIFMSALIGGLGSYLVQRTVGNIAHVTLEVPSRDAGLLLPAGAQALVAQQKATGQRETLRTADAFMPSIEAMPGVRAVSPQIVGNGFVIRGQSRAPVSITGVDADKVSSIADIEKAIVAGTTLLSNASVLVGRTLADDLGVSVGQVIRLQSDRNVERSLVISGIFELGVEAIDARAAYVSTATARVLMELPQGVSKVEVKLFDLNQADAYARQLGADTGLKATSWTEGNASLLDGLKAQANSGNLIKGFALVTIVIGVASALLLSTYRRRPEIGIMRAFGASRGFVIAVFVIQGTLIGVLGALIGAGLGYLTLSPFPVPEEATSGGLPIDVRQGAYGLAIGLTALGAILASILPARAAAKVDPVSVIGQ
jgi:lipoprotein-releasing system permease protein